MINAILIQERITPEEFSQLITEFPQFQIIALGERPFSTLSQEELAATEVIYGSSLSQEEYALLDHLHWIHSPTPYVDEICVDALREQERVLISTTKEENIEQIGEFALAGALAFTKNLFRWNEEGRSTNKETIEQIRKGMWSTTHCTFLQIGLGMIGSEIARRAKMTGYTVWGVEEVPSFHPHCQKTFPLHLTHSLLPTADIVSLAMPRDKDFKKIFCKEELSLMKKDAALLVIGAGAVLNISDLEKAAAEKNLRGVLLDAHFQDKIPKDSPLRKEKNVIITENSAFYPLKKDHQGFYGFLFNLRQFLHGNYSDMKNLYLPPKREGTTIF